MTNTPNMNETPVVDTLEDKIRLALGEIDIEEKTADELVQDMDEEIRWQLEEAFDHSATRMAVETGTGPDWTEKIVLEHVADTMVEKPAYDFVVDSYKAISSAVQQWSTSNAEWHGAGFPDPLLAIQNEQGHVDFWALDLIKNNFSGRKYEPDSVYEHFSKAVVEAVDAEKKRIMTGRDN